MKKFIREGDTLREYGGRVLAGHGLCFGKGIATSGDAVLCNYPIKEPMNMPEPKVCPG